MIFPLAQVVIRLLHAAGQLRQQMVKKSVSVVYISTLLSEPARYLAILLIYVQKEIQT